MIKKSILGILTLLRHLKWHIDALTLPKIPNNIPEFKMDKDDRLLVIAPHADDELIGCHSLISRFTSQTKVFYCSFLGDNTAEENRLIRQSEFCAYMQKINADYEISSPKNLTADLSKTIKNYKPTIIALPSFIDWHKEHRRINEIVSELKILNEDILILWYHISIPIPPRYVNSVSPIDKDSFKHKWDCFFTHYKSQIHMDTKRFMFVEGMYASSRYVFETYLIQPYSQWVQNLNSLSAENSKLDSLKSILGNISEMHRESNNYYLLLK